MMKHAVTRWVTFVGKNTQNMNKVFDWSLFQLPTESATARKQQIVLAGNMALIILLKIF